MAEEGACGKSAGRRGFYARKGGAVKKGARLRDVHWPAIPYVRTMTSIPTLSDLTSPAVERRALQVAVAVAGLIPVAGGLLGARFGAALLGGGGDVGFDSHYRYLSGLLFAIGLGYWSTVPRIETHGERFAILTFIVAVGGFCRAMGLLANGFPGPLMTAALGVELVVTPALYLWQSRVARLSGAQ